jgi:hypothetical protein
MSRDKWDLLGYIEVTVDESKSTRQTDKYYATILAGKGTGQSFHEFYNALNALERGCGYPNCEEIRKICQECITEDAARFLRIVETKNSKLTIVILLLYADLRKKIEWVNLSLFNNDFSLFETLRQLLNCSCLSKSECSIVASGLCQLVQMSKHYFQYLYERYLMCRPTQAQVMSEMFRMLPKDGWEVIGACSKFHYFDLSNALYWDECAKNQSWSALSVNAEPFIKAWLEYSNNTVNRIKSRNSLYNDYSVFIINILGTWFNSKVEVVEVLLKTLNDAEHNMLEWYESEHEQKCVLLSYLSIIEHIRRALMISHISHELVFSDSSKERILSLLEQTSHLWRRGGAFNAIESDIEKMKSWIVQSNKKALGKDK